MNFRFVLMLIFLAVIKDKLLAQNERQLFVPHKPQNEVHNVITTMDDMKDTNKTEKDLLVCNPGSVTQLLKVDIASASQEYSRLCDLARNLTNFRISINVTLKTKKYPIETYLKVLHFQESRVNGSAKVNAIGFVESGAESIKGMAFYVVYDVPNLNLAACFSLEGLTKQTGVGELIFANLDIQRLEGLHEKYNSEQLVSLFRKHNTVRCVGATVLTYLPGLLNEEVLEELYPISNTERRETSETVEQILEECEVLSANILKMEERSNYKTWDSCDATDLFDRYENDMSQFKVYFGNNSTDYLTEVRILYSNGFREKGSFYGIAIGIIINGPRSLIGSAYLEIQDIKNFDPYSCQKEPGIKQLFGSVEKIIANIDVQSLLSVMDLHSILMKLRSHRVADCIGSVSIQFLPGLVFSDVLIDKVQGDPENKIKFWQLWKNQLKQNRFKKLSVKTLGTNLGLDLIETERVNSI